MNSCGWIEHFYRNACEAQCDPCLVEFSADDLRSLLAVRPGQLTRRSSKLLMDSAQAVARTASDGAFLWAVRLYIAEQDRQRELIEHLAALHRTSLDPPWYSRLGSPLLDTLPIDSVLRLLRCRANVAARFFGALSRKSPSPQLRLLSERLADEHAGQTQFLAFAISRLESKTSALPQVIAAGLQRSVTLGIATRVWVRQRRRLRQAGETFGGFVTSMADQAASL